MGGNSTIEENLFSAPLGVASRAGLAGTQGQSRVGGCHVREGELSPLVTHPSRAQHRASVVRLEICRSS